MVGSSPPGVPASPRDHATASVLRDGRVLIAGGVSNGVDLETAELYEPATGGWTPTDHMAEPRYAASAALPRGWPSARRRRRPLWQPPQQRRVVRPGHGRLGMDGEHARCPRPPHQHAAQGWQGAGHPGGFDGANAMASTELYDPATGTWSPAVPMLAPRMAHSATLLPNGSVLAVGGFAGYSAELPLEPHLPIIGVSTRGPSAEVYDSSPRNLGAHSEHVRRPSGPHRESSSRWASARHWRLRRHDQPLAEADRAVRSGDWCVEPDGQYGRAPCVAYRDSEARRHRHRGGGRDRRKHGDTNVASAERYQPATRRWMPVGSMGTARSFHTATLLFDGRVLIAGGRARGGDHGPSTLALAEVFRD